MAGTGINIQIDFKALEKAMKKLSVTEEQADKAMALGLEEIGQKAVGKVQEFSGNFDPIPSYERTSYDSVTVTTGNPQAKYVEYGTGIVGENNPHPNPEDWEYDINSHGDDGWLYIGKDGKLHWTKGQPARAFMYKTSRWAKSQIVRTITKHARKML